MFFGNKSFLINIKVEFKKNREDFEKLQELASLQNQVAEVRLQDKLS